MAENILIKTENESLMKKNESLRIKLFSQMNEKQQKLSEMAVDNLAQKTVELIDGAIRKAQGKIK